VAGAFVVLPLSFQATAGATPFAAPNLFAQGWSYAHDGCHISQIAILAANVGDADAGSFAVVYQIDGRWAGAGLFNDTLQAGASTWLNLAPRNGYHLQAGNHLLKFALDALRNVAESNEQDNLSTLSFSC
jgi:hypothetical protein